MKSLTFILMLICLKVAAQNTYTGTGAGNGSNGNANSAFGAYAGDIDTGSNNTFIGYWSGKVNSSGWLNTFVGAHSGYKNTTGSGNIFLGVFSGYSNTTGSSNAFVGYQSGYNCTTGFGNSFVGQSSGYANTTGSRNTSLGYGAAFGNVLGSENTFIGYSSGSSAKGNSNTFIGAYAGYYETGSNKLYIDNSTTSTPLIYGDFASDKVGINSLPNTTHTLTVGGTIHASGIYVNGQSLSDAGFEFWTKSGTNVWNNTGNVGIGTPLTNNPHSYKLAVNGKLGAHEVQIENNSLTWSDFVFNEEYKLLSLEELELYIKLNKHLPEIPTAQEVKENGILLGEMNAKLLQKIEELTLHLIDLKKEVEALKKSNNK